MLSEIRSKTALASDPQIAYLTLPFPPGGWPASVGIGAALPATEIEAEYLGEASDSIKEQAVDFASEQATRAATVAEDVVTAVSDEARKQGLTLDAAKSAVADIPGKVGRVVDAAGKGISETLNQSAS